MFGTSQMALVVKNLPVNAGDTGDVCLIPGLRQSPGGRKQNFVDNLEKFLPVIKLGKISGKSFQNIVSFLVES